jgi:hypothetical protein
MQTSNPTMDIKQARAVILREWFALSPDQRATETQAAQFADRAMQAHEIPVSNDNSLMIKRWLVRYTGLKPLE